MPQALRESHMVTIVTIGPKAGPLTGDVFPLSKPVPGKTKFQLLKKTEHVHHRDDPHGLARGRRVSPMDTLFSIKR